MLYFVKTPFWLRWLYKSCIWKIKTDEKKIYLTFDDGPHPHITPFVLDQLKKYNAKATFFCIGANIEKFPDTYRMILDAGHAVGNHTFNHLNGWKTEDETYLDNIRRAAKRIDSDLFRPPYGRITRFQLDCLKRERFKLSTIMWSVLSGDFDCDITSQKCLDNVIKNADKGDIVVFHDSDKAWERMQFALPHVLSSFSNKGFSFEKLTHDVIKK